MTRPVVVAGEALVDLVPTPDGTLGIQLGGGPFNTALALGRLGQAATFLGGLSTDRLGQSLAGALTAEGVGLDPRLRTDRPTSLALAQLDDNGAASYGFYLAGTAALDLTPELAVAALPRDIAALHVGSLGLVVPPLAAASEALMKAVYGRAPVMLDANVRPAVIPDMDGFRQHLLQLLTLTDVLKVSDADLAILSPDMAAIEAARALLTKGPSLVLLTLGAQGAIIVGASGALPVMAPAVTVVDTIGAGDIFSGAWLAHLLERGGSLVEEDAVADATRYACLAASLSCTRSGASPPTRAEMLSGLNATSVAVDPN